MSCCNLSRIAAGRAASPSALSGRILLRSVDRAAITLRGPSTGRTYIFTPELPVQPVESRDAAILLRLAMFRRA